MNTQKILYELDQFLRIESVSADKAKKGEILSAVTFLTQKLRNLGCKVNVLNSSTDYPLVIATRIINKRSKTVGIYGHYDVQPADPVDEWDFSPFQLSQHNGKLYGRGIADNKGHIIQNIAAIESLISQNKLNNNIVFILEGEEESGSIHFEKLVTYARDIIEQIDVQFITDTGMYARGVPEILYGLRGLVYFEIALETGKRDLHSGLYGNSKFNPIAILSELFFKIKNSQNDEILIPEFNINLRKIFPKERSLLQKLDQSFIELKEVGQNYKTKIFPSFDIHGIWGGYSGEGGKTVIPYKAGAKFSFRLVEYQQADEIEKLVREFIRQTIPVGVEYELKTLGVSNPFYMDLNNRYIKRVARLLTEEFAQEVVYNRSGGSIPAAEILQRLFGKPIILTGFTLPDDNIHAPNENFDEDMFWKGIEVLQQIYSEI